MMMILMMTIMILKDAMMMMMMMILILMMMIMQRPGKALTWIVMMHVEAIRQGYHGDDDGGDAADKCDDDSNKNDVQCTQPMYQVNI